MSPDELNQKVDDLRRDADQKLPEVGELEEVRKDMEQRSRQIYDQVNILKQEAAALEPEADTAERQARDLVSHLTSIEQAHGD